MTRHLTTEEVRKYVQSDRVSCPYCGSYDIAGGSIETDENRAYQKISCNACGAYWSDGYTLDSVLGQDDEEFEYPFGLPVTNEAAVAVLEQRTADLFAAIHRIHDLLYLDIEGRREFYNPDKSWDADTLEAIAAVVTEHIPRPTAPESEVNHEQAGI